MFGKVLLVNLLLAVFIVTASGQFAPGAPSINVNPVNNAKSMSGANPYTSQDAQDVRGSPSFYPIRYYD